MASTSSAASSTSTAANSDYDVFINHRGPDVKKTLASHLYRRLLFHGVRAFLDQQELQRGEDLTSQIVGAIGSASVHVAIFSERYAESKWCLNELLLMLESKAPVIPVFYHVKPHELRYAQAIQRLEKKTKYDPQTHEEKLRHDSATVEKWRNALSQVADISGFELEACNGDEGELVDKVVERVLKKVKRPGLYVAKYATCLDDKIKDFENTVLLERQHSGKPRIVGIVGLGGIGKTTLAKEFFNRKSSDYSKTCFLADVRDNASKSGLILLQKKLLRSLNVSDNIDGVDEGIGMLSKHLSSSRALIILDEVDHLNQVDALLPHQSVHSDSLVVITSRDKDVLTRSKVENTSLYKLTGLDTQHSQELFCSHAFNQPYPLPGFESLVLEFLKSCNGLPLSLKVFGALLYGKDISVWEDELQSLQQILPTDILQCLKISYNSLNRQEQQIFLDSACFFRRENMDMAIRIWDGSGWQGRRGFETLRNKCLVEVDSENNIQIHDHLRDMGRYIDEEPGSPRRLWRWTKNVTESLFEQSLNGQVIPVRGIRMVYNDIDDRDDALSCIPMMMGLQLLDIDTEDGLLGRILTKVQRPNLIWLRFRGWTQFSMPAFISMKNLRVLHVVGAGAGAEAEASHFKTLWEKESQAPIELRELQVKAPLSNIPESIGKLKHLERIVLSTSNLTKLPECFGSLTNLRHINLSRCDGLDTLPDSFGKLIKLQYLNLRCCSNLTMSSETLGNIGRLEYVNLYGCKKIEVFPPQVAHQRSLEELHFGGTNIKELPSAIGELSNLEVLQIGGPLLDTLPPSLCQLKNLKQLWLYKCEQLKCLPPSLGDLWNLKELRIKNCYGLKCLPASIGQLTQLTDLWIERCPLIRELPFIKEVKEALSDLESSVDNCILPWLQRIFVLKTGISEVSFAEGVCCNLRHLYWDCEKLKSIRGMGQLTNLEKLNVGGCSELEEVEGIQHCKSLQWVAVYGCPKLQWSAGVMEQLRDRGILRDRPIEIEID